MYSQERRAEGYKIIYTWKVLEGLLPNCGIHPTYSDRRGTECIVPVSRGKSRIQTLRDQGFQVNGPRIFNCLALMPDQPKIGDMIPSTCNQLTARPSNSLLDVTKQELQSYGGGWTQPLVFSSQFIISCHFNTERYWVKFCSLIAHTI